MIDLENVWLPGINECAEMIVKEKKICKKFESREISLTSREGFDELLEQVFQDLDSENQIFRLNSIISTESESYRAISEFLNSLTDAEKAVDSGDFVDEDALLHSEEWKRVKGAAHRTYIALSE